MAKPAASRTRELLLQESLGAPTPDFVEGDFGILVDSREADPWQPPDDTHWSVVKLEQGDYSLACYAARVAVERKSLVDFMGSLFNPTNWPRFERELERLRPLELKMVVVETTAAAIRDGSFRVPKNSRIRDGEGRKWAEYLDRMSPERVISAACVLHGQYGIPTFFAGSTAHASRFAFRTLRAWWTAERARALGKVQRGP